MRDHSEKQALFYRACQRNHGRLWAIARSYAGTNDLKDLHQEILLQLWKSLDNYQGRAELNTWVYRVALHTAMSFSRRAKRIAPAPMEECGGDEGPHRGTGPRSQQQILQEFVDSLGSTDRTILLLSLENLSHREISDATGLSERHITVRINRLKKSFIDRYIEK